MQDYNNVFVMDHPLIQHKLTFLRDISTGKIGRASCRERV